MNEATKKIIHDASTALRVKNDLAEVKELVSMIYELGRKQGYEDGLREALRISREAA